MFKVGDKVRFRNEKIIFKEIYSISKIGKEHWGIAYTLIRENGSYAGIYNKDALVPVTYKFKVGDKVRVVGLGLAKYVGTVKNVNLEFGSETYTVEIPGCCNMTFYASYLIKEVYYQHNEILKQNKNSMVNNV